MLKFLQKLGSVLCLLALCVASVPFSAQAATLSATRVSTTGNGSLTMAPGEFKNVTVSFQNTGTTTWKNDGPGYLSLYTHGPKYRTSLFDPGTWLSASQVKRIIEPSVAPGATGSLTFALHAPATEGTYKETFSLASEGTAWVPGGEFTLAIDVKKGATTSSGASTPAAVSSSAVLVAKTADSLQVKAGKTVSFTALFKNTGSNTWTSYGLQVPSVASTADSFRHSTWVQNKVADVTGVAIKPGESATVQFFFAAPKTNGTSPAKFQFVANGVEVAGAMVEVPVTVTGGSRVSGDQPVAVPVDTATYIEEPTMRVGVLIIDEETDNEVVITSFESGFTLQDDTGKVLGTYPSGKKVEATYANGKYLYNDGSGQKTSANALRFVPEKSHAVMTITNFDRRVTRKAAKAYNTFRNVLEIRYNASKDRTWVINELKMEYYLRGLAETSNSSPAEFQKTLLTAARTYAYYHWQRATKHKAEGYHVDAYLDQVYWGYGQEEQTPNITAAVEATRGRVVTYNGETAITAYFSRSDGRTRNWSDVWGGNIPWSVSVPVPCDVGKTLWGHGVGMSASGALCMANDGQSYDKILKHFYTGIDTKQQWK